MKSILNYTTSISVEKTAGEIQKLLAQGKAQAILTEFDGGGVLTAISFRVMCPYGVMSFRLPANIEKVFLVVQRDPKIPKWNRTREQAARVAWRIIKDWLDAQLAIIQAEMVTIDQVFLPFAQNGAGVTVYESLKNGQFQGLALPAPRS